MTAQPDMFEMPTVPEAVRLGGAPPFQLGASVWRCWVTAVGDYVWCTDCGQYFAWRVWGEERGYRAARGQHVSQRLYGSLVIAMHAAVAEKKP